MKNIISTIILALLFCSALTASDYATPVYREQGGAKLVAGDGGELEVQSGGTLDCQSGSSATLAGTNTISGTTTVSGSTTLSGATTVSGALTASGGATLSGTNVISGATTVSGATTLSSKMTVDATGEIEVASSGTLDCQSGSSVTLAGTNTVSGTTTVSGATTASNLTVSAPLKTSSNVGTISSESGISGIEYGDGIYHSTDITLTALSLSMVDNSSSGCHGSIELYEFPEGHIQLICAHQNFTTLTAGDGGLADAAVLDIGVGTVAVADTDETLASTEQDLVSKDDITLTGGSGDGAIVNTTAAGHDGSDTAKKAYLNVACTDATSTGNDTLEMTGTVTIVWIYLKDD